MMGDLTSYMMRERIEDRLRVAAERRRAGASPALADGSDPHNRQLALVLASPLFSGRRDAATHRR